jgi:hypothetical protein
MASLVRLRDESWKFSDQISGSLEVKNARGD